MDSDCTLVGSTGVPGYRFPFPRMNNPGNLPNSNMAFSGPMRPPNFPTYNRSSFQNHVYFADNPELQGSSFWVGPFDHRESAMNKQQTIPKKNKKAKQQAAAPPQEAPPAEETKAFRKKGRKRNKKLKLKLLSKKYGIGAKLPQLVGNQPQNPGGAAKNPQTPIPKVGSQPQNPGGAAKNPQTPIPTVGSQPQNPGGAAINPKQPIPTVGSQPQNPGVAAINPQQTTRPSVNQPANAENKHQEQTGTQNGDLKRPRETEKTTDADVPTPPDKKEKTEKMDPPAHRPNFEWRGDTSTMFSCNLCQYFTHDEQEIRKHLLSYQHKEILKHLSIFFPKDRVDFIHEYLVFRTKQISMEKKMKNLQPINDTFKGIGPEHFVHRIQAAYCQICDLVIPDVPHNVITHIRSDAHSRKRKATIKDTKISSIMAAKDLLVDKDVVRRLKLYNIGQNPFKDTVISFPPDTPGHSKQVSSSDDVLVAEEDDEDKNVDGSNDEDATADGGASQEFPDQHKEHPGNDIKDSDSKVVTPVVPETMGPGTTSIPKTEQTVKEEEMEEEEEEEEAEAAEAP
ncbi:A-kinase anchor protein 8-like isoform X2 [Hyla sarda]|uniref:A-kinase anchor protein 8-like isoform X2 n=1 Tax=Hyla sarda TaxID=327740 RepID=UPI0024C3BB16|nr:A-kinase anchor protein 8-like isoform X2 [Hyla sarda]